MAKLLTGTRIYGTGTVDTQLFVSGTNSATSTTTGALQVVGGVGIGGNLHVGGIIYGAILGTATTATNADNIKTVLQVSSATYYPAFVDANNSTAAYEALYTTSSFSINPATGAVSITGTSSTAVKLQLGQSYAGQTYTNTASIKIIGTPNSATDEIFINLVRDRNPGVQFAGAASITLGSYITPTGASPPSSRLTFLLKSTSDNTDIANISVLSLLDTGNVGIGTTSPTQKLQLGGQSGSVATPLALQFSNDYSSGSTALGSKIFLYNTGGTEVYGIGIGPTSDIQYHAGGASNTAGKHIWYVANSEKLRITTNGGIAFSGASNYGVSGQILQSNGDAAPTWISTGSLAAANATTATHLSGGVAGQIPYQTAPGVTSFLSTGTAGNVLVSNGSSAPTYNNTLTLTGTTAATSTTTGALQVVGGVGVGGDLYIRGDILTNDTTFNLINTNATTVNFAGAATALTMGASGSGTTNVRNNLTVSGNLTVQGTTTIVDSTVTNIADPILTLGGGTGNTAPTADDNKDRGVAFKWVNDGGTTSTGFFGYDDSTGYFTYVQTATITNEVVSGTKGAMDVNLAGGSAMALVYQSSANATGFLAAGTSGYILQTNGTGSPPTWVSAGGVSAGSATYADNIRTISQAGNAVYYPTFVDSNNATNAYESVYTTGTFVINPATGYIGMGTASPNRPLHVVAIGTATQGIAAFEAKASGFVIQDNGSQNGNVELVGYKQTSSTYHNILIRGSGDGLLVQTGTGNVGIGDTAPGTKLTVLGAGGSTLGTNGYLVHIGGTDSGVDPVRYMIGFSHGNNSTSTNVRAAIGGMVTTGGAGNLIFETGSSGNQVERMRITGSGGVSFGTGGANYGSSGQILQSNGNAAPTWVTAISGSSAQVNTVLRTTSAAHYLTFVDSNNASATAESIYTTSSFSINPGTGLVTIAAPIGGDGSPAMRITQGTAPSTFNWASSILNSSLTAGKNLINLVGQAESGANSAYFGFKYVGAGSTSNFATIGLYGYDNLLNVTGAGSVGVGTTSPVATMDIRGGLAVSGWSNNNGGSAGGLEIGWDGTQGLIQSYNRTGSAYTDITLNGLINKFLTSGTERLRITSSGGIAFGGASNYGSAGQMLQSNGDASPTWVALSSRTVGTSTQVNTVLQTTNASYFPTFVDSNNAAAAAESVYTTSSFVINPATGAVGIGSNNTGNGPLNVYSPTALGGTAGNYIPMFTQQAAGGTSGNNVYETTWRTRVSAGTDWATHKLHNGVWVDSSFTVPGSTTRTWWERYPNVGTHAWGDGGTTYMFANSTGVGIGTTSPSGKLHLYQTSGGSNTLTLDTNFGSGNAYAINPFITGVSNGGFSIRDVTNSVDRLVIQYSTGNVGIGTTTPQYRLDINNGVTSANSFQASFGSTFSSGYWSGIHFGYSESVNTSYRKSAIIFERQDSSARGKVHILNNGTASSASATLADAKITILYDGSVGVGTTTPTNKFEVAGTAGQLFSVSDSFTGTIFSANDVSGIPSIEVLDTGLVKLAQYNGSVAISTGTAVSGSALSVYGIISTIGTTGEIRASSEITAYYSSDRRLKENIKLIENPITILDQIRGVTFDWTDEHMARRGGEDGYFVRKHDIGVIAQEVQAVLPELVGTREDGYLAVKYEKMVALLIEAIKEQQKSIDMLKIELEKIKKQ